MRTPQRFRRFLAWTVALVALTTNFATATSTDGVLDPTFGAGGRVYLGWATDAGVTPYDVAIAVLAPSDGSVILVGNGTDAGPTYGSYSAICIAKLMPSGAFDTSFGDVATPGQTKIQGGGFSTQVAGNSAALQPDGKIVIAGNVYYPGTGKQVAAVWRLNADGSPDANFGFAGATLYDRGQDNEFDSANAVLVVKGVQGTPYAGQEGRIVVAGSLDFDPGLVIAASWIFELDTNGIPVAYSAGDPGSNTFETVAPGCGDGYHDQTFSAIHLTVEPDTGAMTYYLAGNCPPRPGTGRLPNAYIAAVDPALKLVPNFGNSENGISQISFIDVAHDYSDSTITSLDVDPGGRRIIYTLNWFGSNNSLTGALDATDGHFISSWNGNGLARWGYNGVNNAGYGILTKPTNGSYVADGAAIVAGQDTCPPDIVCQENTGTSFFVSQLGMGYLNTGAACNGDCSYGYTGETVQGAYAIAYTQGFKVLLAGYVLIGPRSDFAVMRVQGEEIFFNGFGYPSQDFR